MYTERHELNIVTNVGGAGGGYTPVVNGRVLSIQYVKTDYADGVDIAITGEKTGQEILTLTDQNTAGVWYPRAQVHDVADGSALTYDGSNKRCEPVVIANERVKVIVAQGGNTKSGTFYIIVG